MLSLLIAYGAALLVFLVVDAVWIKAVMKPLFERHVAALMAGRINLPVAAGFYVFYVAGAVYFAVAPGLDGGGWSTVAQNGAILGFLAYGTYEATNMATLRGWSWTMLVVDTAWGTVLTALVALAGYAAALAAGGGA